MLFTLSKPHKVAGEKLENRISKNFISFLALPDEEDYMDLGNGFLSLVGDYKKIGEKVFQPNLNKHNYLISSSDKNKNLPTPIIFQGNLYEPIIVKIWLPDEEILNRTLENISETAYLRKIQFEQKNFADNSVSPEFDAWMTFKTWMNNYNLTVLDEQERRKEFKRKLNEYEQCLDIAVNSRYSNFIY